MLMTFSEIRASLNAVSQQLVSCANREQQAHEQLTVALSELTQLPTTYKQTIADVDAQVVANPDNVVWQAAKAEKDEYVAEYQACKARVTAKKAAIEGV